MPGRDGRARVADFGLAAAAHGDEQPAAAQGGAGPLARLTHTGALPGTRYSINIASP